MTRRTGTPNEPKRVSVQAAAGRPVAVEREPVDAIVEDWLVEDRWWTGKPIKRRYWEVVTAGGRRLVIFYDLLRHGWYTQAA